MIAHLYFLCSLPTLSYLLKNLQRLINLQGLAMVGLKNYGGYVL